MIKTKRLNVRVPLVKTGYILFALLVVITILATTLPWGQVTFSSVPPISQYNIALSFVSLAVGAILPAFLGYVIGDKSVKSKSKLDHHFNGILFGLLAYWVMSIFAVVIMLPAGLFNAWPNGFIVAVNLIPSIAVAVLTAIMSIAHVRSRQAKQDVIAYKPFSITLLISIVILPLWAFINSIIAYGVSIDAFMPFVTVVGLGVVAYMSVLTVKLGAYQKVVWSAISVSVFFVMLYITSQLSAVASDYLVRLSPSTNLTSLDLLSYGFALIGWVAYWMWQVKALQKK